MTIIMTKAGPLDLTDLDPSKVGPLRGKRSTKPRKVGVRTSIVDVHIGQRLRALRVMRGLSQDVLGLRCGRISFQQIQKYEKGENRISASRLYFFSKILEVNISFFFEGLDSLLSDQLNDFDEASNLSFVKNLDITATERKTPDLEGKETAELLRQYYSIEDEDVRSRVLDLIKAVKPTASNDSGVESSESVDGGAKK